MARRNPTGKLGEEAAARYLRQKGYHVIGRNLRRPWGEVDILAIAPDKVVVFAEVKTLSVNSAGFKPEDHLNSAKLGKMKTAALALIQQYGKKLDRGNGFRLDLLAVDWAKDDALQIRHFENLG